MDISTIDEFLPYFERVRERTRAAAVLAPPDRLEWRPAGGRFSLGDLIRHIAATERWMWAENVHGHPSRYPGCGPELADGYDAVIGYLDAMHAEAMARFATLTPEGLRRSCPTPGGARLTTWKWLRAMVEHEIHHRGQIYERLADLGIATPPLYGLTEPQVLANSLREA